jgi:hypothetical protein
MSNPTKSSMIKRHSKEITEAHPHTNNQDLMNLSMGSFGSFDD